MSETIQKQSFSWARVRAYFQYNMPMVKPMLIAYFVVSVLVCGLLFLPVSANAQAGIFSLVWAVLPYLMYFSPLVFTRGGDSRKAAAMLPVTAAERMVYYIIYMFVIIPVILFALPYICYVIFALQPGVLAQQVQILVGLKTDFTHLLTYLGGLENMSVTIVCFYFVMRCRSNRVLKGIVSVFATQIVCGIAGAIYGATGLMQMGMQDGAAGVPMKSEEQIMDSLMEQMNHLTPGITGLFIFFALILVAGIWLSYRVLKSKRA